MRKLLRSMAKAEMSRRGYSKVNKRLSYGSWRKIVNAYLMNLKTGRRMKRYFVGNKRYPKCWRNPVFAY